MENWILVGLFVFTFFYGCAFFRCIDVDIFSLVIGVYVANRASDKITKLTDNVYVCRSGSVFPFLLFLILYCLSQTLMVKILD